jgi:hypothetical protein
MNSTVETLKKEYFGVPRGFYPIKRGKGLSRYCIKVTFNREIIYFDRFKGREVTEEEIFESMPNLEENYRKTLREFFEKYPTDEDKMLYWCKGKQKCQRRFTRHFAIELKKQIEEERRNANG